MKGCGPRIWAKHTASEVSVFVSEDGSRMRNNQQVNIQNCRYIILRSVSGTAVAQWLRCCATHQKVAGSIPGGVSRFFIDIKFFR